MNLAKTIADLFSCKILAEHTATGISDEAETSLILARDWGSNALSEHDDAPEMVFETVDGFVISGKTHAICMSDTNYGNVVKELPRASNTVEGESRLKSLSKNVYDTVFELLDGEPDVDGKEAGRIATAVQKAYVKALKESIDEGVQVYTPGGGANGSIAVYGSSVQISPELFIRKCPDYSVAQYVLSVAITEALQSGSADALVKAIFGKLKESKKVAALDIELTALGESISEGHEGGSKNVEMALRKITEFRKHLSSSKFHDDTTIQVADVNRWLDTITKALNHAEESTVAEASVGRDPHAYSTNAESILKDNGFTVRRMGKDQFEVTGVPSKREKELKDAEKLRAEIFRLATLRLGPKDYLHNEKKVARERIVALIGPADEIEIQVIGSRVVFIDKGEKNEDDDVQIEVGLEIFDSISFALGPILTSTSALRDNRELLRVIDEARDNGNVSDALEAARTIAAKFECTLELHDDSLIEAKPSDECDLEAAGTLVEFIKQMRGKNLKVKKPHSDGHCRESADQTDEGNALLDLHAKARTLLNKSQPGKPNTKNLVQTGPGTSGTFSPKIRESAVNEVDQKDYAEMKKAAQAEANQTGKPRFLSQRNGVWYNTGMAPKEGKAEKVMPSKREGTGVDSMTLEMVCPKCKENAQFSRVEDSDKIKCGSCGHECYENSRANESVNEGGSGLKSMDLSFICPKCEKNVDFEELTEGKCKCSNCGYVGYEANLKQPANESWIDCVRGMSVDEFKTLMESEVHKEDFDRDEFKNKVDELAEAYCDEVSGGGRARDLTRKISAVNPFIKKVLGKGLDFEKLSEAVSGDVVIKFPMDRAPDFLEIAKRVGIDANQACEQVDESYVVTLPKSSADKVSVLFEGDGVEYESVDEGEPTKNTGIHDHLKSKGFEYKGTKGGARRYENSEGHSVKHKFPTPNGNHSIHHTDSAGKTVWKSPSASDTEIKQHFS